MIGSALLLLRNELDLYVKSKDNTVNVILDNVGLFETSKGDHLTDHIIISLVNIEEESTLKNSPALKRPFTSSAKYENPAVYLNLYVLFSCNYAPDTGEGYLGALKKLSYIVKFFQRNNTFSSASSLSAGTLPATEPDFNDLRVTMELYTLTFEQINHLWGSLGGRQIPFAMYKLRLVSVAEPGVVREVPLVEEIETNTRVLTNS